MSSNQLFSLLFVLFWSFETNFSQTIENVTESTVKTVIISRQEIWHLFTTFNIFLWILLVFLIILGIYQSVSKSCRLKSDLVGGEDLPISYSFAITIIAAEPSVAYDYDNTSIKIDLSDKNDESIGSLVMRPLWAFHLIQPKPNPFSLSKTEKDKKVDNSEELKLKNLSREVPLIGIYRLYTEKNLKKLKTIRIGHNCPHSGASILIRCIEISNIRSLISHTYPLNSNIPFLSKTSIFTFDATKSDFEFDSSEDLPPKMRYQMNGSLNSIEKTSFWFLSLNMIFFSSYSSSQSFDYESDVWLMWYKAGVVSIIIGCLVAIVHTMITIPYRLLKEYYFLSPTNLVFTIKTVILLTGNSKPNDFFND